MLCDIHFLIMAIRFISKGGLENTTYPIITRTVCVPDFSFNPFVYQYEQFPRVITSLPFTTTVIVQVLFIILESQNQLIFYAFKVFSWEQKGYTPLNVFINFECDELIKTDFSTYQDFQKFSLLELSLTHYSLPSPQLFHNP